MGAGPSAKLPRRVLLPKRRRQVAAVCYRVRKRGIEFLLVQTRGGRWIFPKGGVEPGLTHAQSAALEAFEEAGVHGRMEEIPFARYFRRRPDPANPTQADRPELPVSAHLCEVSRLETPQESNRNPTWFSVEKAQQRLLKDRAPEFGAELIRVVDRALSRIQRLHGAREIEGRFHRDSLWQVRFEVFADRRDHDPHPAILEQRRVGQRNLPAQHRGQRETIRRSVLRL
ncbi:MAG: NUDIX domain-containing protein, partial [Terriglobales bacterium]